MQDTLTSRYRLTFKQLYEDSISWRGTWKDIAEFMSPRKGRYLSGESLTETNDGSKKHSRIINGTASDASRILASGLQGGLTPPSRPWFALTLQDKELIEYAPVREYLHKCKDILHNIYSRSNFYGSVHSFYKELGLFGIGAINQDEDFSTVARFRAFTIGEYMLTLDSSYRPNGLYRKFSMTARQMAQKFGAENVSDVVRDNVRNSNGETRHFVNHVIEPNDMYSPLMADARGKRWRSVYFEEKGDHNKVLSESGYNEIPFFSSRWDVTGDDTYSESPAFDALGDVKMLQKLEEKKLKALDKMVDPPMNAPMSMKGKGGTIVSGGVNYIDTMQGQQGFTPAYQVNPNMQNIAFEIDRVEQRIRKFFLNDLFLAIINEHKTMTAEEVARRFDERIGVVAPLIERLQSEAFNPCIDRTFSIATKFGNILPEPPPEIQGMELRIEYVSILAQAQKMVGTAPIEQLYGFVGNLAGVNPEVLDKLDFDETVDQYAELTGAPPKIVRSDDEVAKLRAQRAQAQAQAQAAQTAMASAEGAKTLSETPLDQNTALDALLGR